MANSTLRECFAIESKNGAKVSRIIRDALDTGKIRCWGLRQKNIYPGGQFGM